MQRITTIYDRITGFLSGRIFESFALLLTRLALAGVFWRSARTKVVEGTALEINEVQYFLFDDFGLPLPNDIAVPLTTYAEHFFPILLVLGLATRFGAAALLVMTMVIQIFVFPDAWWPTHALWAAMALILISRGAGIFSFDALVTKLRTPSKT